MSLFKERDVRFRLTGIGSSAASSWSDPATDFIEDFFEPRVAGFISPELLAGVDSVFSATFSTEFECSVTTMSGTVGAIASLVAGTLDARVAGFGSSLVELAADSFRAKALDARVIRAAGGVTGFGSASGWVCSGLSSPAGHGTGLDFSATVLLWRFKKIDEKEN